MRRIIARKTTVYMSKIIYPLLQAEKMAPASSIMDRGTGVCICPVL